MAPMKYYDVNYTKPGELDTWDCQVCGTECLVERNQMGATSWAGSMARREHPHDRFHCPHSGKKWHERALELVMAIEETPSKSVAALMQKDLAELLAENGIAIDSGLG